MDLERMLEKCEREQWSVGDLDWTGKPRPMSKEDEMAIVQYFTDMAGIERLAGALFREQQKRATDPTLEAIFKSFVKDEVRHSHAAQMLADFYDVNKYKLYALNPALQRFTPHFINAVQHFSPEIANAYITSGELILDIALLRSINDFVGDEMSQKAMDLINRDESRHIAIDFHMVGYYTSKEYAAVLKAQPPIPKREQARAAASFAKMLYYAAPFFKAVFFEPMELVDPSGERLREAFKRIQLVTAKPMVRQHPFVRAMLGLQRVYNESPVIRKAFGQVITRTMGIEPRVITVLYTEAERKRAALMTYDEMAAEASGAKTAA